MKIAILDDEKTQLQLIEQALIGGGGEVWGEPMECCLFNSGLELLEALRKDSFDCVLLDRQLPDISGDVVLQWLRQYTQKYTPVIMLTALDNEEEVVNSLVAGADDYVVKPFRPKELVARVRRLVNRQRIIQSRESVKPELPPSSNSNSLSDLNVSHQLGDDLDELPAQIEISGYHFNRLDLEVTFDHQTVQLTEREFALALLFFSNIGVLLSRDAIFKAVWKRSDVTNSRALDTHLHRVRTKLALSPERGFVLRSVYGFGYRLDSH
ncbi:MAG: srrA [Burkholderiaceae bacterium]|nr:srrA [Burkholderiaceae bacterium]